MIRQRNEKLREIEVKLRGQTRKLVQALQKSEYFNAEVVEDNDANKFNTTGRRKSVENILAAASVTGGEKSPKSGGKSPSSSKSSPKSQSQSLSQSPSQAQPLRVDSHSRAQTVRLEAQKTVRGVLSAVSGVQVATIK